MALDFDRICARLRETPPNPLKGGRRVATVSDLEVRPKDLIMQGPDRPIVFLSVPERADPGIERLAVASLREAGVEVRSSSEISNPSLLDDAISSANVLIQVIPRVESADEGESRASLEYGTAVRNGIPVVVLIEGDQTTRLPVYVSPSDVSGYFHDETSLGRQIEEAVQRELERLESMAIPEILRPP